MKTIAKKIIVKTIVFLGLATLSVQVLADCKQSQNAWVDFPKQSSIHLTEVGFSNQSFNSGLNCTGILALANNGYVKYRVIGLPTQLQNTQNSDAINIYIKDTSEKDATEGAEHDLSKFDLISLFNGPNNSIPFYVFMDAGQMLSPGTYQSTTQFRLRWYYSVPAVALLGVGKFHESPGFIRSGIEGPQWGSGVESSTNFRIVIEPDCRVSTQNISLGSAAFAAQLQPVYTEVGIRCSAKTPYSVSINNGTYASAHQRRLRSSSGHYIYYDIFKGTSNQRWGSAGDELWNSADASSQASIYDGKTIQIFNMRTEASKNNLDTLPAGTYKDSLRMEVKF